jgi:hypothetical protein
MTMNEVIQTLRHGGLRVRTALWLLPADQLTRLPDSAARLGIHLIDVRQPLLNAVAPDQRFLRLGLREFIGALDTLCNNNEASDCLLVANSDLIIAKLNHNERQELWETLYRGFPHRSRALLLAMPYGAATLLPTEQQLDQWRKEGRLVP